MNIHSFDVNVAKKFGVPVAIVLNHIAFWIQKNQANDKHFHDGRHWTYNSIKAFQIQFPYWTFKQMRTVLEKLKESGLILTGNYNQIAYDQTTWYALSDEGLAIYKMPAPVDKSKPICPEGQIDEPNNSNPFAQNGKPIPDIKPDTKTDIKKSSYLIKKETNVDKSSYRGTERPTREAPHNARRHDFADSMNQMASETKHIAEHERMKEELKIAPMPEELRQKIKGLRYCSRY